MADQINKNVQRISLYVDAPSNSPAHVYAKQWDTKSRYVIATIKDHFGRVKIGGVAQLNAKKPDGTFCYTRCAINDDSTVTIEIPTQILAAAGEVRCDISFFATEDSEQVLLTTSTFIIVVQKSNYDTDAIKSSNEYSVVTENLKKANENCKLAIEAAEQTEQNRVLTESAKNDAETAAKTASSIEQSVSVMVQRTEAAAGQVGAILNDVNAAKEASGNAVATATAASDKADDAIKAVGDVEKKADSAIQAASQAKPVIVQTVGESESDIMSQKAVTDALNGLGGGGISPDLLWENAAPNQGFNGQVLKIDTTQYDLLLIEYRLAGARSAYICKMHRIPKGTNTNAQQYDIGMPYANNKFFVRRLIIVYPQAYTNPGVNIGSGEKFNTATDVETDYGAMVPVKIWGIKLSGGEVDLK